MIKPIEYEQTDSRWGNLPYTITSSATQTIGKSGCALTSTAMVVATLRDETVTPVIARDFSIANGYRTKNEGTAWGFFPAFLKKYSITCISTTGTTTIISALKRNRMVICSMGEGHWTSTGHIILAYGLAENETKVLIHDPNSELAYRELGNITYFKNELCRGWIIEEEWSDKMLAEAKTIEVVTEDGKAVTINGYFGEKTNLIPIREIEKIVPYLISYDAATKKIYCKPNLTNK